MKAGPRLLAGSYAELVREFRQLAAAGSLGGIGKAMLEVEIDRATADAGTRTGGLCAPLASPSPPTMRADIIGHFKPCMTDIYLHI